MPRAILRTCSGDQWGIQVHDGPLNLRRSRRNAYRGATTSLPSHLTTDDLVYLVRSRMQTSQSTNFLLFQRFETVFVFSVEDLKLRSNLSVPGRGLVWPPHSCTCIWHFISLRPWKGQWFVAGPSGLFRTVRIRGSRFRLGVLEVPAFLDASSQEF